MSQKIRPSQFVTTYGPGTIIELPSGPAIIPSARIGLFKNRNPEDYEIEHKAMSEIGIPDDAGTSIPRRIFSIPTNDSLGIKSDVTLYRTKPFPEWKLCLNNSTHGSRLNGQNVEILYLGNNRCPICENQPNHAQLPTASAVRFVTVCKRGHLDEVSWNYLLHKDQPNHDCIRSAQPITELRGNNVFFWNERGGALSDIRIECPRCNTSKSFGEFFYAPHLNCSGRHPQEEKITDAPSRTTYCNEDAKIIQRQAASIRMPVIKTLLSIKSRVSSLHEILSNREISSTISIVRRRFGTNGKIDNENAIKELLVMIEYLVEDNKLEPHFFQKLKLQTWQTLVGVIDDLTQSLPVGYHGLILEEFGELYKASIDGAPQPVDTKDPLFKVIRKDRKEVTTKLGHTFLVVPIAILQTVSVQIGFKRDDTGDDLQALDGSELVPSSFGLDNSASDELWYPGVKYTGEGIFIRLDEDGALGRILENNSIADKWRTIHHNEQQDPKISKFLFRDPENSRNEVHPGFVWWHTLAHLLIRIISEECGYSSASIRERIYFDIDDQNNIKGGILLYAAQPGSEGTLGGLTSLAKHFDSYIETALAKVFTCSADPLCIDSDVDTQKINGACCYGCLMNSETSCEHRNMWLDRNVLGNSLP